MRALRAADGQRDLSSILHDVNLQMVPPMLQLHIANILDLVRHINIILFIVGKTTVALPDVVSHCQHLEQ